MTSSDKYTKGLVSAVIPAYNYAKFVAEAVDSILEQSYSPIEIIVVDDGSTDNTAEVLAGYGDKINYIHQKNGGLSAARNTGIKAAKGEYIAFLDADDIWHPEKIEKQLRLAEDTGNEIVLCTSDPEDRPYATVDFDACFFHPSGLGSNALIKRYRFDEIGLFDTQLKAVEDREMMLRLTKNGTVASLLHGEYCNIRVHGENMSGEPVSMESNYQNALAKIYTWDEMDGRILLRARASSYMQFDSMMTYFLAGRYKEAFIRGIKCYLYWPLPFGRYYPRPGFVRSRLMVSIIFKMLGLKK
ncbi:MAG: glycosyltransferase family 2 protein [Pseudomonadales bacterium]|nr:glycosyltransferase family 2 protein [Pseudomonadales bacterium]